MIFNGVLGHQRYCSVFRSKIRFKDVTVASVLPFGQ